jgi:CO/xanthine dehydrogenase Mo-binding subunit
MRHGYELPTLHRHSKKTSTTLSLTTQLNIPDYKFNPPGSRGIGEIGITGAAAAISNAVYNATGKRVRDLPITLDKFMHA